MVEVFNVPGINLPFFLTIIIIFSFFVWSKFLGNKKLYPNDIDGIFDILGISLILTVFFVVGISVMLLVGGILQLTININPVVEQTPNLVAAAVLYVMWAFIINYRSKTVDKADLKNVLIKLFQYSVLAIVGFMGIFIKDIFQLVEYELTGMLLLILIIVALSAVIIHGTSQGIFGIRKNDILTKELWVYIVLVFLVFSVAGFIGKASVKYDDPIEEEYRLYAPDFRAGTAYVKISVPVSLKDISSWKTPPLVIPISYKRHAIETSGYASNGFAIIANMSDKGRSETLISGFDNIEKFSEKSEKLGFTSVFRPAAGLVALRFERGGIVNNGVTGVILEGYVKRNTSYLNYSYSDNSAFADVCNSNECNIAFNITNGLDLPIIHEEYVLFNLESRNIINKSDCSFVNIDTNFAKEGDVIERSHGCSKQSCEFDILDKRLRKDIFTMRLYISDNSIRAQFIRAEKPISINASFKLSC
ncbi:MAG: hypothetical protein HZB68_05700 [Candidatus Aenigmarchaeota archaeon]|nr:hypothetical protein [Candidatus Aenigmarchaeota archaeon]